MSSDPVINYDKMLLEEGVGKLDKDNGIWTCEQTGHVIFCLPFEFDNYITLHFTEKRSENHFYAQKTPQKKLKGEIGEKGTFSF